MSQRSKLGVANQQISNYRKKPGTIMASKRQDACMKPTNLLVSSAALTLLILAVQLWFY
jgi:hypothetical protein|tara:strand:+ start:72211 stop:72387 length:177 start_codon:yes stop_codon:yes gene_type:complete